MNGVIVSTHLDAINGHSTGYLKKTNYSALDQQEGFHLDTKVSKKNFNDFGVEKGLFYTFVINALT